MNVSKLENSKNTQNILLTIDVEDWFQVENLRSWFPVETWDKQQIRVERNTHQLLDLFDSIPLSNGNYPKATFFVLGWIAQRCPDLVRTIQKRGHEIASHGFNHLMCNQMEKKDLVQDLTRSKKILEDLAGVEIVGYRAPNFSVSDSALKLIQKVGYLYDSSYNDFDKHGRYGTISVHTQDIYETAMKLNNNFIELKISNLRIANQIIPWGGGGYFRFLPTMIFNAGVRKILSKNQSYMFYLHPWEVDPNQPKIREKNLSTWRHYLNLAKTYKRLKAFLNSFNGCKFITCSQYIKNNR